MSSENQTPEQAASIGQPGPQALGEMLPEELQRLAGLRQQSEHLVYQIGLREVQKMRLLTQLTQTEQQAQVVLNQAGKRLGIPDGTAWSVTADGKAIMVAPAPTPPASPEAVEPAPEG